MVEESIRKVALPKEGDHYAPTWAISGYNVMVVSIVFSFLFKKFRSPKALLFCIAA